MVPLADGGITTGNLPPAQEESFNLAMFTCMAQYPLDPKYSATLTDDRLGVLYEYYVKTLTPCLEAQGYSVTPAPSKSTFIDTYYDKTWTPYVDLNNAFVGTQAEWDRINGACPQWPENFFG